MEADPVAALCQQLSRGLRALAEEPVPVPVAAPLPHPDAWLGSVAPRLTAARADTYAGRAHCTNPFLSPLPDPAPAPL